MSHNETGELEAGWNSTRYVLMDDRRISHGHAPTLKAARKRRNVLEVTRERELHIIREEREVVPDSEEPEVADD